MTMRRFGNIGFGQNIEDKVGNERSQDVLKLKENWGETN